MSKADVTEESIRTLVLTLEVFLMANGFGSLWIGTSGLMSASNGLNTTANNLSNVNTKGYVREQVVFEDRTYTKFGTASVSDQRSGL